MNESITIHVPIQVELLGEQFVRAKPLGPWRIQAVGSCWKSVRRKLKKRLEQALPTTLPTRFFEGALPPKFEQWETVIELAPAKRGAAWTQPLLVPLQAFRWRLLSGQCVVRIPAVNCTLFGKLGELGTDEVTRQARVALVRLAENRNLLQLRERFYRRSFKFSSIKLDVPIGVDPGPKQDLESERKRTATLRATASDLTTMKLGDIHGIDDRVQDVSQYLQGDSPQSVLLVGPSGVGKTALVHRLVVLREKLGLEHRKIWSTSGSRIVSGMSGLGMWQQRCSKLVRQAYDTSAIVHLGSLYELMEAGKIDGQPGVASMIRQSIVRGRLLAIAECTPEQLALVERDDPMLLRGFVRYECKEPQSAQVLEILRAAAQEANEPQQQFSEQALEELTRLHARFATYSAMPAMPLRLMQTIREERSDGGVIHATDVAREFSKQTGLPRFLVDDSVRIDLDGISENLASQVIGQREPVDLVVNLIATIKARMIRPGRPLASLMFIGPTGVGKTEMAKAIARMLYSDARRMIRIDMSEYSSPWSIVKLIGKPGEGDGALTSPIREQPFSVVLLDEFEKADANVFDLLLQVLGEGRLTDSRGRWADFRNAVVIMTSNLGADSFRESKFGFSESDSTGWREHFERELQRFVRPEFLGRLDRIVPFQPLPKNIVREIALRELSLLAQRPGLKFRDSKVSFTAEVVDYLSDAGYEPKYGARPLRRVIEQKVTVPLADALSELSEGAPCDFHVSLNAGQIVIEAKQPVSAPKSMKEKAVDIINTWQELGAMARCALKCAPMRDLENELERTARHNKLLHRKLHDYEGTSRAIALRAELQVGEHRVITARKLIANLVETVEQVDRRQLDLLTRWHRNEPLSWSEFASEAELLKSQLRHVVEDILQGQITNDRLVTIIVTGPIGESMKLQFDAYQQIAARHNWKVEKFLLTAYTPSSDPLSAEYRRRLSAKKPVVSPAEEPDFRLFTSTANGDTARPVGDVYAERPNKILDLNQPAVVGFALQITGSGALSWLNDEYGIAHFFDSTATGNRRRLRYRVDVSPERLSQVVLPNNWPEPLSQTQRDPRKLVTLSSQEITGLYNAVVPFAQGKVAEGLVELLTVEHERALWNAIGYAGIPSEAQLGKHG